MDSPAKLNVERSDKTLQLYTVKSSQLTQGGTRKTYIPFDLVVITRQLVLLAVITLFPSASRITLTKI